MERTMRLLLLSVALEASKTMAQTTDERKASDLAVLLLTVISFAIFVMGLASVCYRWSSRQFHSQEAVNPFTDSDIESGTSITETRGIDEAIVNAFPTFLYSEVKERRIGRGGVECVVCLCEFEDDETLRLMPNCCHVFHADCVNVWLTDHSTCPLCRVDLFFQPGERSDLIPGLELDGVTWNNTNRPSRSYSTRILSQCRVSEMLLSRSHSTGHSLVQSVNDIDPFTLRLPENVRRQLTNKTVDHVVLTQVKSSRRSYKSKSAGSERSLFSYQRNSYNNRRLRSMTFSLPDSVWFTSGSMAPPTSFPRSMDSGEPSFVIFQPDERV